MRKVCIRTDCELRERWTLHESEIVIGSRVVITKRVYSVIVITRFYFYFCSGTAGDTPVAPESHSETHVNVSE